MPLFPFLTSTCTQLALNSNRITHALNMAGEQIPSLVAGYDAALPFSGHLLLDCYLEDSSHECFAVCTFSAGVGVPCARFCLQWPACVPVTACSTMISRFFWRFSSCSPTPRCSLSSARSGGAFSHFPSTKKSSTRSAFPAIRRTSAWLQCS